MCKRAKPDDLSLISVSHMVENRTKRTETCKLSSDICTYAPWHAHIHMYVYIINIMMMMTMIIMMMITAITKKFKHKVETFFEDKNG